MSWSWRCNAQGTQCQDCYSPPGNDALLWWLYWTRKGWFRLHCPPTEAHMENLSSCSLCSLHPCDIRRMQIETWSGPQKLCRLSQCSGDWSVWELDGSREGLLHRHGVDGTGVIMKAGTENMFKCPSLGCTWQGLCWQLSFWCVWFRIFFTCFYDV